MLPWRGELLPGQDTDIGTESEAPQLAGRKLRRCACTSAAVLALVCAAAAAAAVAPLRRAAAAPRGEEDSSWTRAFPSLNTKDTWTSVKRTASINQTTLTVYDITTVKPGDVITIMDNHHGRDARGVVAEVREPDEVVLTVPLGMEVPQGSYVIRPNVQETTTTPAIIIAEVTTTTTAPTPVDPLPWIGVACGLVTCCLFCAVIGFFLTRPAEHAKPAAKKPDDKDKHKVKVKVTRLSMTGDVKLHVDHVERLQHGHTVQIQSDMGNEKAHIAGFDGDAIVLSEGLRNIHPVGAVVTMDVDHKDDAHGHPAASGLNTPRRKSRITKMFHTLDTNGNGFLSSDELLRLAKVDGFQGSQHQWEEEYHHFVQTHFRNNARGCSLDNFATLVNDKRGFYLSDYDLDNYLNVLDPMQHHHGFMQDTQHHHDAQPQHRHV